MSAKVLEHGAWENLASDDPRIGRYKYVVTAEVVIRTHCIYPEIKVFRQWHGDSKGEFKFVLDGTRCRILPGYLWDGASSIAIDTESSMAPSLFHDCVYQCLRMGKFPEADHGMWRKAADEDFRDLLKAEGFWGVWARVRYRTLRMFGGRSAKRRVV